MTTSERLLIAVIGLICAYFATVFGDGVHAFVISNENNAKIPFIVVGSAIVFILGLLSTAFTVAKLLDTPGHCGVYELLIGPGISPGALCYTFGLISGPIAAGGYLPWYWFNMWSIIAIIGLIPAIIVFWDALHDWLTRND